MLNEIASSQISDKNLVFGWNNFFDTVKDLGFNPLFLAKPFRCVNNQFLLIPNHPRDRVGRLANSIRYSFACFKESNLNIGIRANRFGGSARPRCKSADNENTSLHFWRIHVEVIYSSFGNRSEEHTSELQ